MFQIYNCTQGTRCNLPSLDRYPFSENTSDSKRYMDTRCPSWCDRILLTEETWDWLHSQVGLLLRVLYVDFYVL